MWETKRANMCSIPNQVGANIFIFLKFLYIVTNSLSDYGVEADDLLLEGKSSVVPILM
jgi:hypothetical protein